MGVIQTDKWLLESCDKPVELCEKVKKYFNDASAPEIYRHLTSHGMYQLPFKNGKVVIKRLQRNKVWDIVRKEERLLQRMWKGPNIPIFIFPSDINNRHIMQDFNGKSGLAFKNKLFLFISEDNSELEIKALFTHEYNHVCRLAHFSKDEKDYVLLDTILLEGLAESAVKERLGNASTASWTSYYSNKELKDMWNKTVQPYKDLSPKQRRHQDILYGLRSYPKMLGYCTGYYLVQKYMKANDLTAKEMLATASDKIAALQ